MVIRMVVGDVCVDGYMVVVGGWLCRWLNGWLWGMVVGLVVGLVF